MIASVRGLLITLTKVSSSFRQSFCSMYTCTMIGNISMLIIKCGLHALVAVYIDENIHIVLCPLVHMEMLV